jgi:hypothetical protein
MTVIPPLVRRTGVEELGSPLADELIVGRRHGRRPHITRVTGGEARGDSRSSTRLEWERTVPAARGQVPAPSALSVTAD